MKWCSVVVVLNAMSMLVFFKQIGNFSNFRSMVSECGPDLVVLLFGFFVMGFVLYLSV